MSLPELIPTNLPQFTQNRDRTTFSNSVVPSGSVLLFAESDGNGGSNLIAKNPDGSFSEIGGGSAGTEFYECASVNTSAQTWTGYKAVLNNGVYSFESTATTGLAYTSVTPEVGKIYTADALARVASVYMNIPSSGLVFYAPFSSSSGTAATGQTLEYNSSAHNVTFTTQNGIACAKSTASTSPDTWAVRADASTLPLGTSPCTMSIWLKAENEWYNNAQDGMIGYGGEANYSYRQIGIGRASNYDYGNTFNCYIGYLVASTADYTTPAQWHNLCAVYDGSHAILYRDGVQVSKTAYAVNTGSGYLTLMWNRLSDMYFAAARIYDRVLHPSEIAALASEFTPTA